MESVVNRRRYTKFSTEPEILLRSAANLIGLFISLVYRHEIFLGYPLFGELLIHILLVEWNVHKQQKRIDASQALLEESKITEPIPCIGQVVGYREDPTVFKKCLLGYENDYDKCLKALVIGIDGNDSDDLEMVNVADEVFGSRLGLIELDEPFGSVAERIIKKEMETEGVTEEAAQKVALQTLMAKATDILQEKSLLHIKKGAVQIHPICITQPHACKKDILFTSFIFTHALAQANDIEFIWSSDSDSWVLPNTIQSSIAVVYPDKEIAGTCTALEIHNSNTTVIAQLVGAVYWADLAMSGGSASAADANDCQCGPSSLFRRDPMRDVLLSWYLQVFLNQRPIVNEDRHMTSRLLLAGWKVTYNPFGFVETDTPPRSASWCSQQIRWQRATIIEFFAYPGMFFLLTPVLTMSYSRKIFSPLENMALVIEYLFIGRWRRLPGIVDLLMRITTRSLYTAVRNPSKDSWFITQCFAPIFLQFPQSAFLLYSMMTMFENRWGTAHRSVGEQAKSKTKSPLLKNPGSLLLVSLYAGLVIAACAKYFALLWFPLYATTLIWTAFLGTLSAMLYIFAMDI